MPVIIPVKCKSVIFNTIYKVIAPISCLAPFLFYYVFAEVKFGDDLLALATQTVESTMSQIVIQNEMNAYKGESTIDEYQNPKGFDFGQYLL